jgi:DNA (cytosine-5)-methyltransferase 1
VLENVYGAITSHGGRDFSAIISALCEGGYRCGAVVVNAAHFVPQSRPRLFIIAVREDLYIPGELHTVGPSFAWHPEALRKAHRQLADAAQQRWVWWNLPQPVLRNSGLIDVIEDEPKGVKWSTDAETQQLLKMMSDTNMAKVHDAKRCGRRIVGTIYKRTRTDGPNGSKVQRAEVRFDDVAGCLRTPAGGSSRQTIIIIDGEKIRSRLLSSREAARLMGLPDDYILPEKYNDAYHLTGDGVAVPVVRFLAEYILEPIVEQGNKRTKKAA